MADHKDTPQIRVRYIRTDNRCALWEKNPEHPDGEVFIGPGFEGMVAETPEVKRCLNEGSIEKMGGTQAPKAPEPEKK